MKADGGWTAKVDSDDGERYVVMDGDYYVATFHVCVRGEMGARRRALLGAAAPELYEALEELLRVDDDWHGAVNSEMAGARSQASAALAKFTEPRP